MACSYQPWLSNSFEFLSGMPEQKRQRKPLFMVQAFIDESGMLGKDKVMVLGGFVANAKDWDKFSQRWQQELDSDPRIEYFKMNEAARRSKQFAKFCNNTSRDQKLESLVSILTTSAVANAVFCSIDLEAHAAMEFKGRMKDPYFLGFYHIVQAVGKDFLRSGRREKLDIIFDTNVIFAPRVLEWYPKIWRLWKTLPDTSALANVLPMAPKFEDDGEFMPLQAADMLAWLARYDVSEKPHGFGWITKRLKDSIPMSPESFRYTKLCLENTRSALNDAAAQLEEMENNDYDE